MSNRSDPAPSGASVTPNDSTIIKQPTGIYIGVAGDLAWEGADGVVVPQKNLAVGYHPIRPRKILDTGTDADEIIALYAL